MLLTNETKFNTNREESLHLWKGGLQTHIVDIVIVTPHAVPPLSERQEASGRLSGACQAWPGADGMICICFESVGGLALEDKYSGTHFQAEGSSVGSE